MADTWIHVSLPVPFPLPSTCFLCFFCFDLGALSKEGGIKEGSLDMMTALLTEIVNCI